MLMVVDIDGDDLPSSPEKIIIIIGGGAVILLKMHLLTFWFREDPLDYIIRSLFLSSFFFATSQSRSLRAGQVVVKPTSTPRPSCRWGLEGERSGGVVRDWSATRPEDGQAINLLAGNNRPPSSLWYCFSRSALQPLCG
jgi:hypothetical protein